MSSAREPLAHDARPTRMITKAVLSRSASRCGALLSLFSTLTVACSTTPGATPPADAMVDLKPNDAPPRLSVRGAEILDPDGKPLLLRGWNWGQWGTTQPQDGAANVAQGANVARIPLRWWGQWGKTSDDPAAPEIDSRSDGSPGHIAPDHLEML